MNNLTKAQKDEYATAFSILALYDGGVSLSNGSFFCCIVLTVMGRCYSSAVADLSVLVVLGRNQFGTD
jgi:hypothetical protein